MSDSDDIVLNFKIGVLKELHRRELLSKGELTIALKALEQPI
jgi:hypothetical protein